MKRLYFSNLAPNLNPSYEMKHTGYWTFEIPEEDVDYVKYKIEKINHERFFFGGGHGNVDRDYVKQYVNKIIKEPREESWEQLVEFQNTMNKLIELRQKKIELLELLKKYLLQQFFDFDDDGTPKGKDCIFRDKEEAEQFIEKIGQLSLF